MKAGVGCSSNGILPKKMKAIHTKFMISWYDKKNGYTVRTRQQEV